MDIRVTSIILVVKYHGYMFCDFRNMLQSKSSKLISTAIRRSIFDHHSQNSLQLYSLF